MATPNKEPSAQAGYGGSPEFLEAHISLATVYYRLKRKADGDREKALVQKLTAEREAKADK